MKIGKKYKLIPTEIEHNGKPLYRVKALKNFGNVKAGDVGGYVESEANLSHEGDCWVYAEAKVYDDALVCGKARVYDFAKVSDNAQVCDEARVYGDALISGNAKVCGSAQVYGDVEVGELAHVSGDASVYGNAWVYGDAVVTEDDVINGHTQVYSKRRHAEERENKMSRLKKLEKMWDEYCKASDIDVTDDIQIQLNVSEPKFKVGIFKEDKGMHFTIEEIKALVEVLDSL